ncbi:hypothetical protein ACFX50_11990 [Neisseria meningitidis]
MRRSPCPRGVASETGGAGASPRKAFQLRKPRPKGRRSTAGLSGSQATGRRSTAELGGSHGRKAGRSTARLRRKPRPKGRRSTAGPGGSHGKRQAKHRRASVTFVQAGGGCP